MSGSCTARMFGRRHHVVLAQVAFGPIRVVGIIGIISSSYCTRLLVILCHHCHWLLILLLFKYKTRLWIWYIRLQLQFLCGSFHNCITTEECVGRWLGSWISIGFNWGTKKKNRISSCNFDYKRSISCYSFSDNCYSTDFSFSGSGGAAGGDNHLLLLLLSHHLGISGGSFN